MNKKQIVDLIIAIFLIIGGSTLLVFPLFHFVSVKPIFIGILGMYGLLNLIQFILTALFMSRLRKRRANAHIFCLKPCLKTSIR